MKIYISVDMEGIAGVVDVDQTRADGRDFQRTRELMTEEANAAALGAFDAGAAEVLVNDSHGDMRNLLFERLDPRVQVITGGLKPYSMVEGVGEGCDLAFFVGYHAGMGAQGGLLCHTYSGSTVAEIRLNERVLNEAGLNALVCGAHDTPVGLVTGDESCCLEAKELLGEVETVPVKRAVSRASARSLHPVEARGRIRKAAKRAVESRERFKPFRMDRPYRLEIRFMNPGMADAAAVMPGASRVDGTTVRFETLDPIEAFRAMLAMTSLAFLGIPV